MSTTETKARDLWLQRVQIHSENMIIRLRVWRSTRHLQWYLNPKKYQRSAANPTGLLMAGLLITGALTLTRVIEGVSEALIASVSVLIVAEAVTLARRARQRWMVSRLESVTTSDARHWWGVDARMLRFLVLNARDAGQAGGPGWDRWPPGLWSESEGLRRWVRYSHARTPREVQPELVVAVLGALDGIGEGEHIEALIGVVEATSEARWSPVEDLEVLGEICATWRRDGRLEAAAALADTFANCERLGPSRSGRESLESLGDVATYLSVG